MSKESGTVHFAEAQAKLGLWDRALANEPADVASLIVTDQFHRPGHTGDYREQAVDRLCRLPYSWHSEENIVRTMAKLLIRVSCPRCGGDTDGKDGGGSGTSTTINYTCGDCGQRISLNLDHEAFHIAEFPDGLAEETS